jgi:hypothetical protein
MTKHESPPAADSIITPLVEKIRERVRRGEVEAKYLAIAEYMTNPDAPFPVPDDELTDFFDSMRTGAIAAAKLKNG